MRSSPTSLSNASERVHSAAGPIRATRRRPVARSNIVCTPTYESLARLRIFARRIVELTTLPAASSSISKHSERLSTPGFNETMPSDNARGSIGTAKSGT